MTTSAVAKAYSHEAAHEKLPDRSESRIAFIFPGQGSQAAGMGRELYESSSVAREIIDEAHDAIADEINLRYLLLDAPCEELSLTVNTQPALLTVSLAAHAVFLADNPRIRPRLVAGHSLGEYSALVASGAMKLTDAVRVVRRRGELMQQAVPEGVGSMAAILGSDRFDVEKACEETYENGFGVVSVANHNGPCQTVISGHCKAVEHASELMKERGARKIVFLPVSAPFHCPLLRHVRPRIASVLEKVEINRSVPPLVSNVGAEPVDDPETIRNLLIEQVSAPVRWMDVVKNLSRQGITDVIELGPGRVLSGLVRRIDKNLKCHHGGTPLQLCCIAEKLQI